METETDQRQIFSAWFRQQLTRWGMSQSAFAEASGRSTSTVHEWYKGGRVPDPDGCDTISDVLRVPLDTVLYYAGHRPDIDAIDPDDPANDLIERIRRHDWRTDRRGYRLVRRMLDDVLSIDADVIDDETADGSSARPLEPIDRPVG